jgi:transglutaminase-like putative cysteine protease
MISESLVEHQPLSDIPSFLAPDAWQELDALVAEGDYWEMLLPSEFAEPTPALLDLAKKLNVVRRDDPLMLLHELNRRLYDYFIYVPRSTRVDSPIDEALVTREGVCQDFAHVMIALVRGLGIPCRYVSGYLHHRNQDQDRSTHDATHAWVEAFLPHLGWVGFDPTNDLIASDRHIRAALGRDYADVPPSRGIYRGRANSQLFVAVRVEASERAPSLDQELPIPEDWTTLVEKAQAPPPPPAEPLLLIQAQQQQQQ